MQSGCSFYESMNQKIYVVYELEGHGRNALKWGLSVMDLSPVTVSVHSALLRNLSNFL